MTTEAKRLAELAAKNAALWDECGPDGLECVRLDRAFPLGEDAQFRSYAFYELRPRQRTISVTIPIPGSWSISGSTVWLTFSDYDTARGGYEAIRAAMKEQDGG